MTDRELLELAAKAAGMNVQRSRLEDPLCRDLLMNGSNPRNRGQAAFPWNPLTDDGDALRLAVKLGLRVYTPDDDDKTAVVRDYAGLHVTQEASATDFCAATRLAIVRAAAEIGRAMP